MICGLPALEAARVRVFGADQKKRGLWGRDYSLVYFFMWVEDFLRCSHAKVGAFL